MNILVVWKMFLSAMFACFTCLPIYCVAWQHFPALRKTSLYSSWERIIAFACYKGNGHCWSSWEARGSIHSVMHSLNQARGSGGGLLDSALLSKVWWRPPPHSYLRCLLTVFSCACFLLVLLCCYGHAARLNKSRHSRQDAMFHLGQL